jgi:hypothetical protein
MTVEQAQIIADGLSQIANGLNLIGFSIFFAAAMWTLFR